MKNLLLIFVSLLLYCLPLCAQVEKLEVEGAIQIGNSEDPTPDPGTIRWTGTDFEGWNGTSWLSLTGCCNQQIVDGDGNIYESVTIGTQEWLTTDLHTTTCNDGTAIALVTDNTAWSALTTGAFSWYNNDEINQNANGYGILYNWYAINDCNVCPVGWHVPTDTEWTTLIDFLDPAVVDPLVIGTQSTVSGGELKETGFVHWNNPNGGATNGSGWLGLPGGDRSDVGVFLNLGSTGNWWSSTDMGNNAWTRFLSSSNGDIGRDPIDKNWGFSIRCIKD